MHAIRHLLAQRHLAVLVCVAALLLKLFVPTGYMIASDHGRPTITVCPGIAPRTMTMDVSGQMSSAMPAMHGEMAGHGRSKDHGKPELPCAFAGLSAAVLGAIDPIQLAALIAFVMAIGLAATRPPSPSPPAFLRPPLRGPPAHL